MMGDGSAYAVLGIDPAADSDEIEQAYRRLIKQHHPDRTGGDAARAAEINRAYRELRGDRHAKEDLELNDHWVAAPTRWWGWLLLGVVLLGATALLLSDSGLIATQQPHVPGGTQTHVRGHRAAGALHDPIVQPLDLAAVDSAARQALQLYRTRDEMALASASRNCHRQLRNAPSVVQLDRCAAFDDTVVELEDRDPLRDQGPFSELAVTGRLWSGATALSDDSVAIDTRLDRIRLRVELTLAKALPAEPPVDGA